MMAFPVRDWERDKPHHSMGKPGIIISISCITFKVSVKAMTIF
jgi:hypothetical protein